MSVKIERICTMLVHTDKQHMAHEIKANLEGSDVQNKRNAMKGAILLLLNGEQVPGIFITIVRYVLPSEDHTVQRLLLLYLETIEKVDASGKLLPEMILICQNLRNNLQHPNEYIRGVTLRFLCKIHEEEILDPLVPSILANLDHRHSYVRRNAILAINEIYRLPKGQLMLIDAAEQVENMLSNEQDLSSRRNAFVLLCNHQQDKAINFLLEQGEAVSMWGDLMQFAALDLIRKVCRSKPSEKGRYIKVILALLNSTSTAVIYECAVALVSLSHAPTAIKAAANCFCQLLVSQSDNNVKLIVLDRLSELKEMHQGVIQDMVMDVLRALASPDMDIREKTLKLAMELITPKNIDEVVQVLKKEVMKTNNRELDKALEYRTLLVHSIHSCALKFPDVAGQVVYLLMDFLYDTGAAAAIDVAFFVREITHSNPSMRSGILSRLLDTFSGISSGKVCCSSLWILGEYSSTAQEYKDAIQVILDCIGPVPIAADKGTDQDEEVQDNGPAPQPAQVNVRPVVLADGTYATQAAVESTTPTRTAAVPMNNQSLRRLILAADYYVACVACAALTKLYLKLKKDGSADEEELNKLKAQIMLVCVGCLRVKGVVPGSVNCVSVCGEIDNDSKQRIMTCLNVLVKHNENAEMAFLEDCRTSYEILLKNQQQQDAVDAENNKQVSITQPDDLIDFTHLKFGNAGHDVSLEDEMANDMARATGASFADTSSVNRINRIVQLTGFADPAYAEAVMTVHQYDIVLDVVIINRTQQTMQNLSLELFTMGDLKLVERPQTHTLGPGASKVVTANIKVSSTETGIIFGNITYDTTGHSDRNVVVLADVNIDIMDYISPATCTAAQFRAMWAEFEWENKVTINTSLTNITQYLDHIINSTNMKCLTPPSMLDDFSGFVTANLYAKSVFGEDALVNISIEQVQGGKLCGYIRIRSKTQGIALSLGEKITIKQKGIQN